MAVKICRASSDTTLFYVPDNGPEPTLDWFDIAHWQTHSGIRALATGRATTWLINPPADSGFSCSQIVWRHYMRGGLIGKLVTDQFLYTGLHGTRAYRELTLLDAMRQQGLPVPLPIAARVVRTGSVYRADLLTGYIPDSKDLLAVLVAQALPKTLWYKVGETIAYLHQQQIYHHDLNIKNIMLDEADKIWIIDFDRCAMKSGQQWKTDNLLRLQRSLHKQARLHPSFHFSEADWQHLQEGYAAFTAKTRSPRAKI